MAEPTSTPDTSHASKNAFTSAYGFLMTVIGFAVGIGTIWRFPYMLGENGGSLYLITYIVIIAVICIPLLAAEIVIGFKGQATAVKAYAALDPTKGKPWRFAGWFHLITATVIIGYILPIFGWILRYLVATPMGELKGLNSEEVSAYFGDLIGKPWVVFAFCLVNVAINCLVIANGVKKGVEMLSKILLPGLGIIMLILIIFGLTLDNAGEGVAFLLKPDPSKFGLGTIQAGLGQAFFAVGVAMLASLVFGSYVKNPKENIGRASTVISSSLVVAGLLAAFMVFPVLFSAGVPVSAGPGLVFQTLPNAFNQIPFGTVFGTVFYIGFYFAAVTSSAGLLESIVGMVMDQFNLKRSISLAIVVTVMTAIGAVCIFAFDPMFDILDQISNNYLLPIGAFAIAIFVGWIWGIDKFIAATNVKSNFAKLWLKINVKYVSPVAILILFFGQYF